MSIDCMFVYAPNICRKYARSILEEDTRTYSQKRPLERAMGIKKTLAVPIMGQFLWG